MCSALVAGCTLCGKHVRVEWSDSTVYDNFPPAGEYGPYSVSYREPPQFVERSGFATTEQPYTILSAHEDGFVAWDTGYDRQKSGDYVRTAINATFDALGIQRPTITDSMIHWSQGC